MKLSRHAFTRFWDVHAWVGVTAGLVLHAMFFAGGFSLFYEELLAWQEGAAHRAAPAAAPPLAPLVERVLRERNVTPTQLDVAPPSAHRPYVEIGWRTKQDPERHEVRLDPNTGSPAAETSRLANILFFLHFLYHPSVSWGIYVAGLFAVVLLLAIVTGVLIHIKDIVRQFHQFRPGKTVRVLWSDLHKVLGVMGLPFQIMYALTGAIICFGAVLAAIYAPTVFSGDRAATDAALRGRMPGPPATGRPAPSLDVDELRTRAAEAVPGFRARFIRISHVGDEAATARLWGAAPGLLLGQGDLLLRARDGALLADNVSGAPTAGATLNRWVFGLHYVWFGGLAAKVAYALLALATCLTILSGNWIWLARREAKRAHLGNRLLARLTVGIGGGVLVATAALFWANRLAPPAWRPAAEAWAFFGVWGIVAGASLLGATRSPWVAFLRTSGVAFALVPIGSALTGPGVGQPGSGAFGVELGLVVLGLTCWGAGSIVRRRAAARAAEARPEALGRTVLAGQDA